MIRVTLGAVELLGLVATISGRRNGLDLVPPMGWSNWESSGCEVNESYIKANADALKAKGLLDLGYNIVETDDCWAESDRNASGFLVPNRSRFPSGMDGLGKYLHNEGFKFAMYSSAGTHCCQGTMPGSLGFEWIDAMTFASWGVDFLKYDGCYMEGFNQVEQDAHRRFPFTPPPILRYPVMGQALNMTGRPISFMCNFPWQFWGLEKDPADGGRWVSEVCNSWRVAGDPQPGFANAMGYANSIAKYASDVPSGPGGWATLDAIEVGLNGSFDAIDGSEAAASGQRQIFRLGGGGMTADQEKAAISVYMIAKTPIFIGANVVTLSGHTLEAYSNADLIAIHQDSLAAPGKQILVKDSCIVWACALSGGRSAAALVNSGSAPIDITVSWNDLDALHDDTSTIKSEANGTDLREVTDVWKHKKIGSFDQKYVAAAVPPTSAVVILVYPSQKRV